MPDPKVKHHSLPKEGVFVQKPERPYDVLGRARARVDFPSLDRENEETALCQNYYNKAVKDLLKRAEKAGGDAVVEVRSVVYLADGRVERYETAECSDDGAEGQILVEGWVAKWKSDPSRSDRK
jgi:hypothetical protein